MWGQNKAEINSAIETLQRGYAKIDLDAVVNNMNEMHKALAPNTCMLGVVKTNGYGHGAVHVCHVLEDIDYVFGYAVAAFEEARQLRTEGIKKPIIILSYSFPYCYEQIALLDIRPAVFREDTIPELCEAAKKTGKKIKVHIKVDTGMGRIGITPDDAGLDFVKKVVEAPELELEGVFTHLARADEYDKTSALKQINTYSEFVNRIEKELGIKIPLKHCSNSAGILELSNANFDMVRAGITMYGLMPSDEVSTGDIKLKAALSLHSHIAYVKTIHKGQSVSYGGLFTAEKDTRVATIPLGYGDGYPRLLTGKGSVLIRGQRCPILGRICMDQFMVDVSAIKDIRAGEEVVLIGESGDEKITAEEIGALSGRFNYELVCLLHDRLPRVYYLNGEPVYVKTML